MESLKDQPFTYLWGHFKFFLLRYFYISPRQLFIAILLWTLLTLLWVLAFKIKNPAPHKFLPGLYPLFITSLFLAGAFYFFYQLKTHKLEPPLLLFAVLWLILYFPGKCFIKKAHAFLHRRDKFPYRLQLIYLMTLLTPLCFFYFFSLPKSLEDNPGLIEFSFISLLYWVFIIIAAYGIYGLVQIALKKYISNHMRIFSSTALLAAMFWFTEPHMRDALPFSEFPQWFPITLGVFWLVSYLTLDYGLTLFFKSKFVTFKRANQGASAIYWYQVKLYLLLLPVLVGYRSDVSGFHMMSTYFNRWGTATIAILILHLATTGINKKKPDRLAPWIITTTLSLSILYLIASSLTPIPNNTHLPAILSITTALIWLCILLPLHFDPKRAPNDPGPHSKHLHYFHQNPFWPIIRSTYAIFPIVQGIYSWISLLRQ